MEIKIISKEKLALEKQHKVERDKFVCDRTKLQFIDFKNNFIYIFLTIKNQ